MKDPTPVHWKSRDQIEQNEENVDASKPCKKRDPRIVDMCQGLRFNRAENEEKKKGDGDVHRWPRERNREFLGGLLWHARDASHSTNRQQDHVRRLDPEAPGHKDVTEFVENDAGKDKNDEQHTVTRRKKTSLLPSAYSNPDEQKKEG
jgi:hypothetical protein